MEYFIFRILVAGCFLYVFIEFMVWINKYDYDDIPHSKSSRRIHIDVSKENKY